MLEEFGFNVVYRVPNIGRVKLTN